MATRNGIEVYARMVAKGWREPTEEEWKATGYRRKQKNEFICGDPLLYDEVAGKIVTVYQAQEIQENREKNPADLILAETMLD